MKQGFGCFFRKNGDYYLGGWDQDVKSGVGLETCFEEKSRLEKYNYYGMFANGVKEGHGTLEVDSNLVY